MCSSIKCKSNKYNKIINNTVTKINKAKTLLKQFRVIVNANPIVHNVIQIKNGIMININLNVKSIAGEKKNIAGIIKCAFVRIVAIWKVFLMIRRVAISTNVTSTLSINSEKM